MKKILNIFFVTLGIIFFVIIVIGLYFFFTDPLNLKPLIFRTESNIVTTIKNDSTDSGVDNNSVLSESQIKVLETFGIDSSQVPSEITPEQESCFIEKLGASRVNEIKAGDSPTATEFFKARECIN